MKEQSREQDRSKLARTLDSPSHTGGGVLGSLKTIPKKNAALSFSSSSSSSSSPRGSVVASSEPSSPTKTTSANAATMSTPEPSERKLVCEQDSLSDEALDEEEQARGLESPRNEVEEDDISNLI